MKQIFISYSRKDKPFAEKLCGRLEDDGFECFLDTESIKGGQNWFSEIYTNIDNADFFIIILSHNSVKSNFVKREYEYALKEEIEKTKKIIPLKYKRCEIPGPLSLIQYIEVFTDELFEKNYPKICEALGANVITDNRKKNEKKTVIDIHIDMKILLPLANRPFCVQFSVSMGPDDDNTLQNEFECKQLQLISGKYHNNTITINYSDNHKIQPIFDYFDKALNHYQYILVKNKNSWQSKEVELNIRKDQVIILENIDRASFLLVIDKDDDDLEESMAHLLSVLNNQTALDSNKIAESSIVFAVNYND